MDKAELRRHNRNVRDRHAENLHLSLRDQLLLVAELLCDSHRSNPATDPELIDKAFNLVLQMKKTYKVREGERQALAQHFQDCPFRHGAHNDVSFDGNMLSLSGHFDMRALADRMVWIGVAEPYRTVTEEED